jgi:hypothetical protein
LSKWIVSGLGETKAKSTREIFKAKIKNNSSLLTNPSLDEAFYIRLKSVKNSAAAKNNIDPLEKVYRNQTYKLIDAVKPLMFLASRIGRKKKSRKDTLAVRAALKLWAVLYNDVTTARRRNILSQIYPQNIGLLDNKGVLPVGGKLLFGPKFVDALVDQVNTLNKLDQAGKSAAPPPSQPRPSTSSGSNTQNRYVQTRLAFSDSFGGRIALFAHVCSQMTQDPWILATVCRGFELEFLSDPYQSHAPSNAVMSRQQKELWDQEIVSLFRKGATVKAVGPGFISSIFLIPKKTGGHRPIINLKNLNKFLVDHPFKMEGISTIRHTVREGDWLAKLYLKDAYLTVPVFEGHRKFLRFVWRESCYEFVALPFGLSSAPWAFTKLLRVVVAYLRKNRLRLIIYLDDILIVASSLLAARSAVALTKKTLESLGFVISLEKSVEDPVQILEYLGLSINTITMKLSLPEKKISDI